MATEVFNNIGETEISERPAFYRRHVEEENVFVDSDKSEKIESQSKPIVEAKKEFSEHLEDDSLTTDTCNKLNQDWKRG